MIKTKVTGIIKAIGVTKQVTDTFQKRSLLIDTSDEYNPLVCIDFVQAKTAELDNFRKGQKVEVSLNIYSKESPKTKNQYFHNISGWKIEAINDTPAAPAPIAKPQTAVVMEEPHEDDLPF